jgi:hypothetical protein
MYKVRQAAKRIGATSSPGKFGGPWVWDMKSASALKVTIVPDIVPDGDSVGVGDVGSGLTPGVRDHEVETFEFAPGETEAVLADVAGIFDYLAPRVELTWPKDVQRYVFETKELTMAWYRTHVHDLQGEIDLYAVIEDGVKKFIVDLSEAS